MAQMLCFYCAVTNIYITHFHQTDKLLKTTTHKRVTCIEVFFVYYCTGLCCVKFAGGRTEDITGLHQQHSDLTHYRVVSRHYIAYMYACTEVYVYIDVRMYALCIYNTRCDGIVSLHDVVYEHIYLHPHECIAVRTNVCIFYTILCCFLQPGAICYIIYIYKLIVMIMISRLLSWA